MAIREDADTTSAEAPSGPLSISDAADAFLSRFTTSAEDAKEPSEDGADEKRIKDKAPSERAEDDNDPKTLQEDEDPDEDAADPDTEDDTDDGADEKSSNEKPDKKPVTDDDIVEITVDGETKRASVRELKRLFGQEAALTRKSQEVAETRKGVEQDRTRYAAALDTMVQRARDAFDPYAKIDFLVAQQRMDPEAFAQLRQDAQKAHETLKFLEGELGSFIQENETKARAELQERAKEAVRVLQDPEKGIPGWNNALYDEIRTYSIGQGLTPEIVNTIVDPAAVKLLWKAMRYDKVQQSAREKVQRKISAPTKPIKTQARDPRDNGAASRRDALVAMRKAGGTLDSATDAFLALDRRDRD